jgi:hypothetical protein
LNDSIPRTLANRVAVSIQIVYKVDLAGSVDSNLIAGTNLETWVVAGSEVLERLTGGRVGLFINSAGNRKLLLNTPRGE